MLPFNLLTYFRFWVWLFGVLTESTHFCGGTLVPRGFWEREPVVLQWKPWSSTAKWGENAEVCGKDFLEIDCSITTSSGNVTSLVLCHFLGKFIYQYSCKSLECWPRFALCSTTSWLLSLKVSTLCLQVSFFYFPLISKESLPLSSFKKNIRCLQV